MALNRINEPERHDTYRVPFPRFTGPGLFFFIVLILFFSFFFSPYLVH